MTSTAWRRRARLLAALTGVSAVGAAIQASILVRAITVGVDMPLWQSALLGAGITLSAWATVQCARDTRHARRMARWADAARQGTW